ncbi:hypothetical protein Ddc_17392 [Ditylenchus destructor]|nr:hypothetical protein Ddc_17392 [Ditylenchus destructor]
MRNCEEHLKHCYEIPIADRIVLATKYNLNGFHMDMTKNWQEEHGLQTKSGTESLLQKIDDKNFQEKQKFLKEFENRWTKDVTFLCSKKMLQDHAQDEITLEGVESADVLQDFFLAISPLRIQPNPTNVLPLLKLALDYGIPFLMRNCEEHLKQCSEIPAIDRFLLAMKYDLSRMKLDMKKHFYPDDFVKILGELTILEHKQEVFSMMSNYYLGKVLEKGTEILSEVGPEFLHKNIAERMGNCNCA